MARRKKITGTIRKVFKKKQKSLRERLQQFFKKNRISARNEQMQMVLEILELNEKRAVDILTAEVNLSSLPLNASLKEIEALFKKTGHSRLPVYEDKEGMRHYVGVFFVKDLVAIKATERKNFSLASHLR
ncbi:MAG TPA: CBS domain-containing protein, partial [Turneriella sp.]|nr:CBS domain-containing protein [Turneriella sp.]